MEPEPETEPDPEPEPEPEPETEPETEPEPQLFRRNIAATPPWGTKKIFSFEDVNFSLKNVWRKCSGSKILEVGLWLPPSPHPIPHAALWVLLYTKYCKLNFLKKRNFGKSGRAKGF